MRSLANPMETGLPKVRSRTADTQAVRAWLFVVAGFVFAMILVGGATRLTGSGLSITEWQPILGVIPPLSDAAWQEAFNKYQQIPQYKLVNSGMSLDAFKSIYWWEWTHRLLGRLIGFVFLIPFVFFLIRGSIPKGWAGKLSALFILGAAQGALGWFMVKSGLADRVSVSQYRLAAHLALAVAIAGYAFWLALSAGESSAAAKSFKPSRPGLKMAAASLAALIYLQIVAGAFVAGLKGGLASPTWPLMNGKFVPDGLDYFSPWYLNLFDNPLTAQFVHRMLAYGIALFALAVAAWIWANRDRRDLRLPVAAMLAAIIVQIALGVVTVIYGVPLDAALAHQANAILSLALALWVLHRAVTERYTSARA
ncbi:MAG TPA: COX15/CtaA family protein [Hyphomicrobiales bacterium]|nr:COX15/CtaA family protein [Hyphomicrobiales bacterium]